MSQPQLPQPEGVDHRFVELPGLRIHVAEAGSGVPVLLLHGFPQHWWEWREVIPTLAAQFRVKEVLEQEGAFLESVPRRRWSTSIPSSTGCFWTRPPGASLSLPKATGMRKEIVQNASKLARLRDAGDPSPVALLVA